MTPHDAVTTAVCAVSVLAVTLLLRRVATLFAHDVLDQLDLQDLK
jgi:hypothetical protein